MGQSRTTELADAVVDALNAQSMELAFTAHRYTLPMFRLDELNDVQVSVIPRGRQSSLSCRDASRLDITHKLEIGIQKRLNDVNSTAECDPMGKLVEDIEQYLLGNTIHAATCMEVSSILADDSLFAKEHIQSDKVYTSVLVATFVE